MDAELFDRLRRERAEAWRRAELYAKYADALEKGLKDIARYGGEDSWEEEIVDSVLYEANYEFKRDWDKMKKEFGDDCKC